MQRPSISVCMATYNGGPYIAEQVTSILAELHEGDELIVVDDASKDNTIAIIQGFGDERISVHINEKNSGHVRSFEKSILLSKNEIILLADQDDVWMPGRVDVFIKALSKPDVLLATSNAEFIDQNGGPSTYWLPPLLEKDSDRYASNIISIFLGKISYYGCAMAFRRELIPFITPIPKYVESHDLWIAMAANLAHANIHVEAPTFFRRIHGSNVTLKKRSFAQKIKSRKVYYKSYSELKKRLPHFYQNTSAQSAESRPYQICSRTIMDTSDPNIMFNEQGESDYYTNFQQNILPQWNHGKNRAAELETLAEEVKKNTKGQEYNCIIGVSGGLDSSYCAYLVTEIMGLKPLLYHVDAGWNSEQAVSNIEKMVDGLGLDLYTDVINWDEMKDLQRSFLQSQIADQDMPQDVAFFSSLYRYARANGFKYIFTGGNYSTESVREPEEWGAYPGIDKRLIYDIHGRYGKIPLQTFPVVDILTYRIFYRYVAGIKFLQPLNLVPYLKVDAEQLLSEKFGWKPFQHKHHESRFTRFYEDYWLPVKFGYDKRRAHFSSLILSGQMSREEALERIKEPELSPGQIRNEKRYIAQKLDFSEGELNAILERPNKTFHQMNSKYKIIKLGVEISKRSGLEKRLFR